MGLSSPFSQNPGCAPLDSRFQGLNRILEQNFRLASDNNVELEPYFQELQLRNWSRRCEERELELCLFSYGSAALVRTTRLKLKLDLSLTGADWSITQSSMFSFEQRLLINPCKLC